MTKLFSPSVDAHATVGLWRGLSRRWLLAGSVALMAAAAPLGPVRADIADEARQMVETLGTETLAVVADKDLSFNDRQRRFKMLFARDFDVPTIGRYVTGRYWARASAEEQAQYMERFGDYIAAIYALQFRKYGGETFRTTAAIAKGDSESFVPALLERQGQNPMRMMFQVKKIDGKLRIADVAVEDVSMTLTKREEFMAALSQEGMPGLLRRMASAMESMQTASARR